MFMQCYFSDEKHDIFDVAIVCIFDVSKHDIFDVAIVLYVYCTLA